MIQVKYLNLSVYTSSSLCCSYLASCVTIFILVQAVVHQSHWLPVLPKQAGMLILNCLHQGNSGILGIARYVIYVCGGLI